LSSPVRTALAEGESRWQEIVSERGNRPVQERYAATFGVTILPCLAEVFPTRTCDGCCPSALLAGHAERRQMVGCEPFLTIKAAYQSRR